MNLGESQWLDELYIDHKPIPFDTIDLIRKSICKIEIKLSLKEEFGTGFFFKYKSFNYLITNEHVVSKDKKSILIEIWDKTKIKINLENRFTLYLQKPKDITVIELEKNEIQNVQYLDYDLNYIRGYKQYLNKDVLSIGYPKGEQLSVGSGKIKEINENNNFEFYHNSPTDQGSSGSPIILFHLPYVIGVHKKGHKTKKLNSGTFIFEIFNEIEKKKNEKILIEPNNNIKNEEIKDNNIIINDNFNYININDVNDINDKSNNFYTIKDDEKINEISTEKKSDKKYEINSKSEINCIGNHEKPIPDEFDLIYLVDVSGSMSASLNFVKEYCIDISQKLEKELPQFKFSYGGIFYSDPVDESSETNIYLNLTTDINEFKNYINNVKLLSGGDGPEDWYGAYDIAVNKIKWRNGIRCIIHITDAGAHGTDYCPEDKYPEEGQKLDNLIPKCAEMNLKIFGFKIGENADYSFKRFETIFKSNGGKLFEIKAFDSCIKNFQEMVVVCPKRACTR